MNLPAMLTAFAGDGLAVWIGVFVRVGAAFFLMPGLGGFVVPVRVRLAVVLAATVAIAPAMPVPPQPPALARLIVAEAAAGLLIGTLVRMMLWALTFAGRIIAQQISPAAAFPGPASDEAEPALASLLTLAGTALFFAAGLHITMLGGIADSYRAIPFGLMPDPSDAARSIVERGSAAISLAVQLSLPFLIMGFLYNLALGAMNRAMASLMVVLVGAPAQALGGLVLAALAAGSILALWLRAATQTATGL